MRDNFDDSLKLVLIHEGGWSDHKSDPGGATMQGITLRTYSNFLGRQATKDELRNMKPEERDAIYRLGYWDLVHANELPSGIDHCTFDIAVNSGSGRAAKILQEAIGVVTDGQIGPKTLAAIRDRDPLAVINRMSDLRLAFLQRLDTWAVFGKGWGKRVEQVREESLRLAERSRATS